jgi:hypothetical protein
MTDFYPVLARAVSRLASDNRQARQDLYAHARTILIAQLRGRDPQISAMEIMLEQAALEKAIRKLELESRPSQSHRSERQALLSRTGNPVTVANDGRQTRTTNRELNGDYPELQSGLMRERTSSNRIGSRSENNFSISSEAVHESDKDKQLTIDEDVSGWVRDPDQLPDAVITDVHIERSLLDRNAKIPPGNTDRRNNAIRAQRKHLALKEAEAKPASVRRKKILGGKKVTASVSVIPISIALIVTMLAFIAIISIPLILLYIPRMVWLSQHLIDNPTPLFIAIPIMVCLLLLLFLPFFRKGRKKSAFRLS